ncbi:phage protein Gp27 family protein [Brevundimonas sp.]|uniref:phage protein Gp27 family protein n=1 Tax=Brevundimonas sp. TaxID=1871086 RepID=UPI003D6CBCFB
MARSSIEKLPPDVRDRLEDWLREFRAGRLELDEVMHRMDAQFADQDVPLPSRSAVHRHSQKVQALAERVQQSRDVANQVIAQIGPDLTDGKGFQVLVQGFQSLAFDLMANLGPGETLDAENLMFLSRAIQAVTSARKTDADLHMRLKQEAAKEAAAAVDRVAKREAGLTSDTVDKIKREILGIDD